MTPRAFGSAAGGQAGRGIPPFLVEEVLQFGVTSTVVRNGVKRTIYTLGDVKIVTEKAGKIIITVLKSSL